MKISRRKFIRTGGYVAIGFSLLPSVSWIRAETGNHASEGLQDLKINDWLQVLEDGRVRIFTGKMELGQGIRIVIAQVAAEELNTEIDRIEVHLAETGVTPDEGYTAGSRSVAQSAMSVRRAAAAAAGILLQKAAEKYNVPKEGLYLKNGKVLSRDERLSINFYELLEGEQIETVVPADVKTKPKEEHEIVGTAVKRKDIADMVRGNPVYVQDLRFPGMLHARMVRPAAYSGHLASIDTAEAEELEEVVKIVVKNSFVGVLARDEYQAEKAGKLLQENCRWEIRESLQPAKELSENLKSLPSQSQKVAGRDEVEFDGIVVKASYSKPYLMHAAIGPSCAVAFYDGERMQIWSHSQGVYPLRKTLPELLGIPEEQIRITGVPGSGCYGHNGADDVAAEAALLALEMPGKHVRLQWTREDEHRWEPYGSAMLMELQASLSSDGKINSWRYDLWSDTHSTRPGGDKKSLLPTGYYEGTGAKPPRGFLGGGYRNADPYYELDNNSI
jgi:CO/xanthine dehydrogenase Mo-binding subunit